MNNIVKRGNFPDMGNFSSKWQPNLISSPDFCLSTLVHRFLSLTTTVIPWHKLRFLPLSWSLVSVCTHLACSDHDADVLWLILDDLDFVFRSKHRVLRIALSVASLMGKISR